MKIRQYNPYRIAHTFTIPSRDLTYLEREFPNGVITKKGKLWIATYKYPMVVDRPSDNEIAIFDHKRRKVKFAMQIPQDSRGFDTRTSGLARSVKNSKTARKKAAVEIAKEKHMASMNLPKKAVKAIPSKPIIPPDVVYSPPLKKEVEVPKIKPEVKSPIVEAQKKVKSEIESAQKLLNDAEKTIKKEKKDEEEGVKESEISKPKRSYGRRRMTKKTKPEPDEDTGEAEGYKNPGKSGTEEK